MLGQHGVFQLLRGASCVVKGVVSVVRDVLVLLRLGRSVSM